MKKISFIIVKGQTLFENPTTGELEHIMGTDIIEVRGESGVHHVFLDTVKLKNKKCLIGYESMISSKLKEVDLLTHQLQKNRIKIREIEMDDSRLIDKISKLRREMQKSAEELEHYMFENKVGEFSE